ncbi:MAG TPA: ABC transporter permease [Chitinophagaceae bacterium]
MFKNYFKATLRSLLKNKSFSAINIVGLTAGLTCCILMVLYIQHEMSYDKFQEKGDRIARVIMEYKFSEGELSKGNFTSTKVFPSFKRNFPEVEDGVRMTAAGRIIKYEDKLFTEKKFFYADSTFFNIFSFKLLRGKAATVLGSPKMVVLTESTAKKYFGNDDPVGKVIQVGSMQDNYQVTGVTEDCPSNSQIKFDFLASFSSLNATQEKTYFDANFTTYLLLKDKGSIASLQSKIGPFMQDEVKKGYDPGTYINFELEPYTRVHLYSAFDGFEPNSNIVYIYIIAAIALLILAIACFTYINLSTARSMERAKEVGIRKVSGAFGKQIFWQFITESLILAFVSLVLSYVAVAFLLPSFNGLTEKSLAPSLLFQPSVLLIAAGIVLTISLLAGSYPALILSKFQPIKVLKGSFKNTSSGVWLRKSLIVFQFSISIFLIVSTFIIQRQLRFIQTKKMGYDREHVMVMNIDQKIIEKIDLFKTELKTNENVLAVSKAQSTPVDIQGGYSMNSAGTDKGMSVKGCPVDDEYITVNNIKIIAGADFTKQDILDANKEDYTKSYYHYILNESAAKALGWDPQQAIGKKMFLGAHRPGEVKAVIKDFHFASLHNPIDPLVLFPGGWGNFMLVKTSGKNLTGTIAFMEKKWKELAPHRPFEYRFLDEDFDKLYASELRTGKVFSIFASLAILLACIGLFGLSTYAAQQRIKEIGVRKVLGASMYGLVALLSKNFLKLVVIAILIATPLAWWLMNKWLQDFAYRVNIDWWVFAIAAAVALFIALLTVSSQAIKTALANPVKSLRTE